MHIHLGRRSWIAVTAVIVVFTLFVVARNALHAVKIKGQINRLTREELLYREQIGRDSMLLEQLVMTTTWRSMPASITTCSDATNMSISSRSRVVYLVRQIAGPEFPVRRSVS